MLSFGAGVGAVVGVGVVVVEALPCVSRRRIVFFIMYMFIAYTFYLLRADAMPVIRDGRLPRCPITYQ